ncbi:MAG TPA: hypothetical protein VEW48_18045 [Thermoanaerobaculia bacterium]|nr:hypothetical protein [Thermoanaerobaculia bacterium]
MIIDRTDTTPSSKSTKVSKSHSSVGQEEAERIIKLLDDEIVKSRRSRRKIERELGWSQGYLGSVLRGRIGLKVWHVFALARELGLEPLLLFMTASPPRDPIWIFEQLGIPLPEPKPEPPPPPPAPPPVAEETPLPNRDELEEMMRKLLREELERFGLLELIYSR